LAIEVPKENKATEWCELILEDYEKLK
jgi:hypothetical protein